MKTRGKVKTGKNGQILVERFSPIRRVEHWIVAIGFILLVVTGFPQKYPMSELGHFIVRIFGGIENARLVHRVAGIVFGVVSVLFVVVTVGFGACVVAPLAMLFAAWPIVTSIVGAMQANEGKPPRVPLTIRIIS